MRDPAELQREDLERTLRKLQQLLWLDDSDGQEEVWNPAKDLGHEALDVVIAILRDAGLAPCNVKLGDS